jgi:hypothetical protein
MAREENIAIFLIDKYRHLGSNWMAMRVNSTQYHEWMRLHKCDDSFTIRLRDVWKLIHGM